MILLIGGPSRCGKSTVAREVQAKRAGQSVSLDNLRRALLPVATPNHYAALSVTPQNIAHPVEEWLDILRTRDRLIWQTTKAYLESAAANHENEVLIEGDVWPDFLVELTVEHRAVFLVDTSPSHVDRILAIARSHTDHNWMSDWSDEQLRTWAAYNIERSKLTKKFANECGYRVYDAAGNGLEYAQTQAIEYLAPDDL